MSNPYDTARQESNPAASSELPDANATDGRMTMSSSNLPSSPVRAQAHTSKAHIVPHIPMPSSQPNNDKSLGTLQDNLSNTSQSHSSQQNQKYASSLKSEDMTHSPPARRRNKRASTSSVDRPPIQASSVLPVSGPTSPKPQSLQPHAKDVVGPSQTHGNSVTSCPDRARFIPKPLIPDPSLYTNPDLLPKANETTATTLEELAYLVRTSKYQERKCTLTRRRLHGSLVCAALSARLTRCGEITYRNLADGFRRDGKEKGFAALYSALHDVRRSCEELRRFALLEPQLDFLQSPGLASSESLGTPTDRISATAGPAGSTAHFLNDISATSRATLLRFLVQLRTNPDYVATRICALTSAELNSFTSFHRGLEPVDSVLPHQASRITGGRLSSSAKASANADIERLLSFQRHDALSALIHTCFAHSTGPAGNPEDRKRTDIWATTCARLISESKSGMEPFLISVLNVWTAMRDWSGKSNMEWYLMKILEDGAFLLEDYNKSKIGSADRSPKDTAMVEDFYNRAVLDLFEVVDDEESVGIPEGLIELGSAILGKLNSTTYVESTRRWFVYRWLFSVFLLGVIIHPEGYGLLAEYHITEQGRQKILKEIAMRAQMMVVDLLWSSKPSAAQPNVPSKVKSHVENILGKFKASKSWKAAPRLLLARSITSSKDAAEVHPYLVVSPADLTTLVNALFPERKPQSTLSSGLRYGAAPSISSMSNISRPLSSETLRTDVDRSSVLGTSFSSTISDALTNMAPEEQLQQQTIGDVMTNSPPNLFDQQPSSSSATELMSNYEDDRVRLRLALEEMTQTLGNDVVRGSCHPCAERWAVLFVSSGGTELSTHIPFDADDDDDDDNSNAEEDIDSSSANESDEDEEDSDDEVEIGKDYHQVRDSVLKLVEHYEIPQTGSPETRRFTPYSMHRTLDSDGTPPETKVKIDNRTDMESESVLINMLTAASTHTTAQTDFVAAHRYWRTLQQLNNLAIPSLTANDFAALLTIFARGPRESIRHSNAAVEEYETWLICLKQSQERHETNIAKMMQKMKTLRDKMWYTTDVRNSKEYEYSRNICIALKTMGLPRRRGSSQRSHANASAESSTAYIYRNESQIVDLLAASEVEGGPNKLSDDQAEKTMRWLQHYSVENFCGGEERIHRFCCEIENCITKLIGENIRDAPVLWSSDLFKREKKILDAAKMSREREHSWIIDDASSIVTESDRRFGPSRPNAMLRDLRSMSSHNMSQHSVESGRFNFGRYGTSLSDMLEGSDYFGALSPVHTIDTASTFWSPMTSAVGGGASTATSRAHSPTTSVTNFSSPYHYATNAATSATAASTAATSHGMGSNLHHPASSGRTGMTSNTSTETVFQQRLEEEKTRFLSELRQALTSLLLSDLGVVVFSRGSETDAWFQGIGQECIDRRDGLERDARVSAATTAIPTAPKKDGLAKTASPLCKPRALEKKKSFGDLRAAGEQDSETAATDSTTTTAILPNTANTAADVAADTESTTDQASNAKDHKPTTRTKTGHKEKGSSSKEFPFKKAYQRLLKMFCVHPNPLAKLNALYELQHLIIAAQSSSGSSRKSKSGLGRLRTVGVTDDEPNINAGRLNPLEGAIGSLKERRSNTVVQTPPMSPGTFSNTLTSRVLPMGGIDSISGGGGGGGGGNGGRGNFQLSSANTEIITSALQALFRDRSIRPKTLFRDLQYIASFVPPSVLDKTDRGKAFWDTGLAALGLKLEVCRTMMEVAYEVVGASTQTRKDTGPNLDQSGSTVGASTQSSSSYAASISSVATSISSSSSPSISAASRPAQMKAMYTLADAAKMYSVTAREGFPTAQRELGFFYLSSPELVPRSLLPLSKPREVFKLADTDKFGRQQQAQQQHHHNLHHHPHHHHLHPRPPGSGGTGSAASSSAGSGVGSVHHKPGSTQDGEGAEGWGDRRDPRLMCLAMHWMEAAEQGGDGVAMQFLRQHRPNA